MWVGVKTNGMDQRMKASLSASILLASCMIVCPASVSVAESADPAMDLARSGGVITQWVVVGPLPNPKPEKGSGTTSTERGAFDHDYLKPLGGEAKARIRAGALLNTVDAKGTSTSATAKAISLTTGTQVVFGDCFSETEYRLAYAYSTVVSARAQKSGFFLGSDDGAKVWVNGKLVFETYPPDGRGCVARSDYFEVPLRKGTNHVLVKVENGKGPWGLTLEVFGEHKTRELIGQIQARAKRLEFLNKADLAFWCPAGTGRLIREGEPPPVMWADPLEVQRLEGKLPLKVRWFDKDLHEVTSPTKTGLCSAYVEGRLRDGTPLRRAISALCCGEQLSHSIWSPEYRRAFEGRQYEVPYFGKPFDRQVWTEQAAMSGRWASSLLQGALHENPDGALLLNALLEAKPGEKQPYGENLPLVLSDDLQLAVKLKVQGLEGTTRPLAPARKLNGVAARVLRKGTPEEAGIKPGTKERIDAVCAKWAEETSEPFAILVARHGVIVTHEAFGRNPDGTSATIEMKTQLASITKAISGLLFARFVDQKLAAIDDPLGKYLPDFPTTGQKALTFRHCFTHTSGLQGHGEWGGLRNPHLENAVLNLLPCLYPRPGEAHMYNGMGYDLAGKTMEVITGKSILRLFEEGLFAPLGISGVQIDDMAFGAEMSAYELGVFGQTLCNRGSYGTTEIVSRSTFDQLVPRPLVQYYPGIENKTIEWGIGLHWMRDAKPGKQVDSPNPQDHIFSMHTIGHGSATNCVLCVDLDNDLVVVQVRHWGGPKFGEYLPQFLMAVAGGI